MCDNSLSRYRSNLSRNPESSTVENQQNNTTKMLLNRTGCGMVITKRKTPKLQARRPQITVSAWDKNSRTLFPVAVTGGGASADRHSRRATPSAKKNGARLRRGRKPTRLFERGGCAQPKRLNAPSRPVMHPCPAPHDPCRKGGMGEGLRVPRTPCGILNSKKMYLDFEYRQIRIHSRHRLGSHRVVQGNGAGSATGWPFPHPLRLHVFLFS